MRLILFFSVFLSTSLLNSSPPITVDLRNPSYEHGVFFTNQGGLIQGEDLRIQAKNLRYTRSKEAPYIDRLEAEGDLMIQYKNHVFVGEFLEYDFLTRRGLLREGKTFSSPWYLGGEELLIASDGSYKVTNAFFTTCEHKESSWDLHAREVSVNNNLLSAQNLRIRLGKIPVFILPSFKINLHKFKEPIFRYTIDWDKGQGPRISARYQFYSWDTAALYGRLEYRMGTGFGGAFESEYSSPNKLTSFVTRSYLGSDRLENAPDKQRRYRLQGAFHSVSSSRKTHTTLTWDKYSDVRMPGDFKNTDFEVNTAQQTLFSVIHRENDALISLKVRPRINVFESIKQDLPSFSFSLRPLPLASSGILFDLSSKAAYLNFLYSDRLIQSIMGLHAIRLEARPLFYRPFHLGPIIFTPQIGGAGIFYGTSPSHTSKLLTTLFYGGSIVTKAIRAYLDTRHFIQPYLNYYGLTHPSVSPNDHLIFSIQDGLNQINQLQFGIRNSFYTKFPYPTFLADLYTNIFLGTTAIHPAFYKIYLLLQWQFPSLELLFLNAWNTHHRTLDFSKSLLRWTINEHAAFSLELRYRSQYDWRKADRDDFILDTSRPESELLLSPLSDQRWILLTHAFIRLNPFWEFHFQSHHGYVNKTPQNLYLKQPYNEFKFDLFTWITSSWKLRISYTHTTKDDRITAGLSLVKGSSSPSKLSEKRSG